MRKAAWMLAAVALATAPAAQAQVPVSAAEPGATASPAEFWRAIGDTTLARLIGVALDGNPNIHEARARMHAARASRTGAALELTPSVTASAGYSRQRLSSAALPGVDARMPQQELWDAGVSVSWELDVFGRVRNTYDAHNALLSAAEEDSRSVQIMVAAELAGAYYDLRGAEDRLAVARRNARNQQRTLELTMTRLDGGRGNALDTERAQSQLSSTLAEVPTLEAAVEGMRNRIAVLLGHSPASIAVAQDSGWSVELPALTRIAEPENAVRLRPDVLSAASQLAARRKFESAARAQYLPRISIGAVGGYTASAFDALGNTGTPRYAVGPVVSWPLLDIGRVKTDVDAARAQASAAAARYQRSVLGAIEEVETSLTTYEKARERLQHLEDAAAASERASHLARLRFEEGASDFLEVLDTERRQLEAQDRLSAGRTEATAWLVAVYRALAGRVVIAGQ